MAQYKAPDQDGTFVADPGRDNPIYGETESLLILSELDRAKAEEEEEEDPFRPPDHPSYTDRRRPPPSQAFKLPSVHQVNQGGDALVPYDDYDANKQQTPPPFGLDPDDDSDDDLMFEEDRLAVYEEKPEKEEDLEGDREVFQDEDDPEDGKREWKYSTAGIKQHGICYKYCCILLLIIIFMLIFWGISTLFNKIFFEDPGIPPPPEEVQRADNETFPENKEKVDSSCGNQMLEVDRGVKCREFCEPMYSSCCNVFPMLETYNYTNVEKALNSTPPPKYEIDDEDDVLNLKGCEFTDHLRGCTSYAKCSAMTGMIDPAPKALSVLCSPEQLAAAPENCEAACSKVQCCFNEAGLSCLVDSLDVCFDYAPCQNLRERESNPAIIVPVAPPDLDKLCLEQTDECDIACEKARCCLDSNSRCFQENFVSCLTYSACEDHAKDWNMTIPPIYSYLSQAPAEMIYACGEREPENDQVEKLVPLDSCPEYCEQVACCYQNRPVDNCFRKDPLGCMAWHHYCQSEGVAVANWYAGQYVLPSPP